MRVSDIMTQDVEIAHPADSLQEAAQLMCECDIGFLPVGENDRLVGTITDRDIAVRAVAVGAPPTARIRDFMTRGVEYCMEDDDLDHALEEMRALKVRRMPVLNRQKRLVGVLSLADAALEHTPHIVGDALRGIARPGGTHSQEPTYAA